MKTAVSVPDPLFRQAEAAARRMKVTRSHLYATALSEYLAARRSNDITEKLNAVYATIPAKLDPALDRAQVRALAKNPRMENEW